MNDCERCQNPGRAPPLRRGHARAEPRLLMADSTLSRKKSVPASGTCQLMTTTLLTVVLSDCFHKVPLPGTGTLLA